MLINFKFFAEGKRLPQKLLVLVLLGVLLFGTLGGAAWAAGRGNFGTNPDAGGTYTPRCLSLKLTEEQREQLLVLRRENFTARQEVIQQLQEARFELGNLYLKQADENAIQSKREEIAQLRENLREIGLQNREKFGALLTEEQLSELEENRNTGFRARGGRGFPGMGRSGNCINGFN